MANGKPFRAIPITYLWNKCGKGKRICGCICNKRYCRKKKKRRLLLMGADIFDPEADLTNWENHVYRRYQ
ncbi:hypothetical protein DWY69_24505 [Eisenbergiella massiliensis]|uniref:Uncharacterized protein n=1 Tax=Eisenbergiella massiliensis TaxID=1720294 RepID=A0A3E3IGR5_9FIRM|nr:hypothetical protein DWY69_24505 [Eisenbergiella massiliensis]